VEIQPVDLTALVPAVLGIFVVLIPVIGLTARFALKPLIEAFARAGELRAVQEELTRVRVRLAFLEQQAGLLPASTEATHLEDTLRSDLRVRS
jgi:hypothetical protein